MISVDWEELSAGPNFVKAARNAMPSGARVAEFLQSLMDITGAALEDIHAIGRIMGVIIPREDYGLYHPKGGLWVLSSLGMKVIIQIHYSLDANRGVMDLD